MAMPSVASARYADRRRPSRKLRIVAIYMAAYVVAYVQVGLVGNTPPASFDFDQLTAKLIATGWI
jgi:hypothetical protein